MSVNVADLLMQGIAAAEAGDTARAQSLLAQVVLAEPASEPAWLWLARIQSDLQRAEYCWRRVLALNPGNAEAHQRLQALTEPPPPAEPEAPPPEVPVETAPAVEPPAPVAAPNEVIPAEPFELPPLEGPSPEELLAELLPETPESPPPFLPGSLPADLFSPEASLESEKLAGSEPTLLGAELPSAREGLPVDKSPAIAPEAAPIERWLVAAIAFFFGLLLIGAPLVWLTTTGRLDSYLMDVAGAGRFATPLAQAPTRTPTIPPPFTLTPAISATPRPTRTPTAVPSATPTAAAPYEDRLEAARTRIVEAVGLVNAGDCLGALPILDSLVRDVPEYADAYAQRALCYYSLSGSQRFQNETRDYLERALSDLDQAIALNASTGDYYWLRSQVAVSLATMEEFRVVRDGWYERALEDARNTNLYGSSLASARLLPSLVLAELGRCQEALDELNGLIDAFPAVAVESHLATIDLCLGQLDDALQHVEAAASLHQASSLGFKRAIILYNLGRRPQALSQLNQLINDQPSFGGERYHLRALIHYEQGNVDQALADIQLGSGNTWLQGGLRSYVLAKIAFDAGNNPLGIEQLRYAEATLPREYGPLLERLLQELTDLGATPLQPDSGGPQAR